jgi:hypothetical protein
MIISLSTTVLLSSQLDREREANRNYQKRLSEVETCHLLGYCRLAWSKERHFLMPKIWGELKEQATGWGILRGGAPSCLLATAGPIALPHAFQ